jgi:hypothetical protein
MLSAPDENNRPLFVPKDITILFRERTFYISTDNVSLAVYFSVLFSVTNNNYVHK